MDVLAVAFLFIAFLHLKQSDGVPVIADPLPYEDGQEKAASCTTCRFLVDLLQEMYGGEITKSCVVDSFKYLCTRLGIEKLFICQQFASTEFQDELTYIIGTIVVNPHEFCALLINNCGVSPFDPSKGAWTLPIPGNKPPYIAPQLPQTNAPKLKVLHLSDMHLDMQYVVGSEADCGHFVCCRNQSNTHEKSDKAVKMPAGYWGTIAICDAPYWLAVNMMQHIAATHKDLDYVVVTGDLESHFTWNYTFASHRALIANVSALIQQYLPGIPVYFAVGNHEGVPLDTFAPHFAPERFWLDSVYGGMADAWRQWIPADQDANLRFRGCYMKKIYPGLRLISLNNNFGSFYNYFLYINQTDPDGTMTWFIQQLSDAEKAGDKVHIIAHMNGAASDMLESWALVYYQAVNRFENTIAVQFIGHTHSEQFYMTYLDPSDFRSRPTSVVFGGPSVTPISTFNPAYRVCTVDGNYPGSSFQMLDYEDWFLNLTEANANPSNPVWKKLYTAKNEYGLSSMLPSEWNNLIERMKTDVPLFNKYHKNFYRRNDVHCNNEACRMGMICKCRKFHHENKLCSDLIRSTDANVFLNDRKNFAPPIDLYKEMRAWQSLKTKDTKCAPVL